MKRNKLTPRALARRFCRAHNDYRKFNKRTEIYFGKIENNYISMDQDETRDHWASWEKYPLRHHWNEQFPEFRSLVLPRPMTHAEARKLVTEQGVLPT